MNAGYVGQTTACGYHVIDMDRGHTCKAQPANGRIDVSEAFRNCISVLYRHGDVLRGCGLLVSKKSASVTRQFRQAIEARDDASEKL